MDYEFKLELPDNVHLKIFTWGHALCDEDEAKMNFDFTYREMDTEDRFKTLFINEYSLSCEYENGRLHTVKLYMHMIFPERLGKRYAWGVDISENAKLFMEFYYEVTEDKSLRLVKVQRGRDTLEWDDKPGILKQVGFPFLVLDTVPYEYGYAVPFKKNEEDHEQTGRFVFPYTIEGR